MVKLPERTEAEKFTPRKSGGRTCPPGTIAWLDAIDAVGHALYPEAWRAIETQKRCDDLDWQIVQERMKRIGLARLAYSRCVEGGEAARSYRHSPLDEEGVPLPVLGDLPDLPEKFALRVHRRVDQANKATLSEIARWNHIKAWLRDHLWAGSITAVVWSYSRGLTPSIAKHFWGSEAGQNALSVGRGTVSAADVKDKISQPSISGSFFIGETELGQVLGSLNPYGQEVTSEAAGEQHLDDVAGVKSAKSRPYSRRGPAYTATLERKLRYLKANQAQLYDLSDNALANEIRRHWPGDAPPLPAATALRDAVKKLRANIDR